MILTLAGIAAYAVAFLNFSCLYISLKISMAFETIHTIIQVLNMVLVLLSFAIIYSGTMASTYYDVPQVVNSQPEFLPDVLRYTGFAMVLVAFLGFFAAKAESKLGMTTYCILSGILMANLAIFTLLVTFGTKVLSANLSEKCYEVLPYFHRGYVHTFGCLSKYTQDNTDIRGLTCGDKDQISTVWEANVGEDYTT